MLSHLRSAPPHSPYCFLVLNLIAPGFGPPLTGLLIDHLGAFHHANASATGVMPALSGLPWSDVSSFQRSCPGGVGIVVGSSADVVCRTAVQFATRQAIILVHAVGL